MNGQHSEPHDVDHNLGVGQGEVDVGAEASLGVDDSDDVDVTCQAEDKGKDMKDYLSLQVEVSHVQGRLLLIKV